MQCMYVCAYIYIYIYIYVCMYEYMNWCVIDKHTYLEIH